MAYTAVRVAFVMMQMFTHCICAAFIHNAKITLCRFTFKIEIIYYIAILN